MTEASFRAMRGGIDLNGVSGFGQSSELFPRGTGIICAQTIALDGFYSRQKYPEHLRRIRSKDAQAGKTLIFLTNNNLLLPAAAICTLHKSRWQVELFFNWITQHLRVKWFFGRFFGTSEILVKSQIWIAGRSMSSSPSSRSASTSTLRSTPCYRFCRPPFSRKCFCITPARHQHHLKIRPSQVVSRSF